MTNHRSTPRATTRQRWTRLALGSGLAAALTLGGAASAFAAPASGGQDAGAAVGKAKTACLDAISRRLTSLDELTTIAAKDRDAGNAAALASELGAEKAGLTGLQGQVQAAGDAATLAQLCPKVVYDYRVYALETPTTHLAVAADGELAIAAALDSKVPALQKLIDAAKAKGTDTSAQEAELADLQTKTAAARQAVTGTGATVIALTPAQFNSGAATPVLQTARTSVDQTRTGLEAAVQDAKDIASALRPSR
jgi:hypothetical protein